MRSVQPGHDAQQARLARAVRAQDADLGAGVERQPDALEDNLVRGWTFPRPFIV